MNPLSHVQDKVLVVVAKFKLLYIQHGGETISSLSECSYKFKIPVHLDNIKKGLMQLRNINRKTCICLFLLVLRKRISKK